MDARLAPHGIDHPQLPDAARSARIGRRMRFLTILPTENLHPTGMILAIGFIWGKCRVAFALPNGLRLPRGPAPLYLRPQIQDACSRSPRAKPCWRAARRE